MAERQAFLWLQTSGATPYSNIFQRKSSNMAVLIYYGNQIHGNFMDWINITTTGSLRENNVFNLASDDVQNGKKQDKNQAMSCSIL